MRALRAVAVALLLAACGDSDETTVTRPDAALPAPDAAAPTPDAPPAAPSFGDFVKDLITNRTSDDGTPAAVDFTSADSEAAGQYDSLF